MEYIKTVTTESTETAITFTDFYPYVWLRNYGETDVLVSAYPDIVSGADEVAVLKAAAAICVPAQSESVYVLGATTIEAHAQDYDVSPWTAAGGGGSGGSIYRTTTALTDGATTNPITVNGQSVTAVSGDFAIYQQKEFLFDGTYWSLLGDTSGLGDLAYKDTATGNFTPSGTVDFDTKLELTLDTIDSVGTLPSLTYTAATEALTFNAGTLPTTFTNKVISDFTMDFTGTAGTVTVS